MVRALICFSAAALGAAALIVVMFALFGLAASMGGEPGEFLPLLFSAPIGAAIATLIIWPHRKGAWAGTAIAFIAHLFMWLIFPFMLYFSPWSRGVGLCPYCVIFDLVATGWLTIPIGALTGQWLVGRV